MTGVFRWGLDMGSINKLYHRELDRTLQRGEFKNDHSLFGKIQHATFVSAIPNKNTWTEAWRKAFIKPKDDGGQAEFLHNQELEQQRQAGNLRMQMGSEAKPTPSDNSIPDRLRRQMAMRMGMQSTVTGAGSLVAPTPLKNKLGQ